MMKRQSKPSNSVGSTSPLHLSLKSRSNLIQQNNSTNPMYPHEHIDETRDDTPKKIAPISSDPQSQVNVQLQTLSKEGTIRMDGEECVSSSSAKITIPELYKECLILFEAKQYRSAELLALYNLTSLVPNSIHRAHALELIADCAFHQSQYLRASSYYKQAFENSYHDTAACHGTSLASVTSSFQAQLVQKQSKCLFLSKNVVEASNLLESSVPIRSPFRTFSISMDLGKMYIDIGRVDDARRNFMDALNKNIYALEAIECLAQIGAEKSVVSKIAQQKISAIQNGSTASTEKNGDSKENSQCMVDKAGTTMATMTKALQKPSVLVPINDIINATFYSNRGSSYALHAWNYWCKLLDQYPNQPYLLLQMALLQSRYSYLLDSVTSLNTNSSTFIGSKSSIFAKIRSIDPTFMEGMDVYAYTLAKLRNKSELGRLCSDLLGVDDTRAEGWATLALFHHTCGDIEKSIAFLEKALTANPRSAFCHIMMGKILQSEGRIDHAIVSYFRANEISKDVTCYEGLVEAYLSRSKYKEAVCTAKEAINFAPRDPRAMTLVGLALMSAPGSRERGRDKAKRTLTKALASDPSNKKALFSLVDLHLEEEEFDTCIDIIKRCINESDGCGSSFNSNNYQSSLDQMYSKMAEVYIVEKRYGDALECYHKALAINQNSDDAQQGLEELEQMMKFSEATEEFNHKRHEYSYQSHHHHPYQKGQGYHRQTYRGEQSELDSVVRAI